MPQDFLELIKVIAAPGTLLLIGKYILGKQSEFERRLQAIEQVLSGYGEQAGLIDDVNWLKETNDRRKH